MSSHKKSKAYLVGGGIASLSAAVYLIKDGGMSGADITIFEASEKMGGSLDALDVSSSEGYSMRGIRMFEEKAYSCLFELMSRVPSLTADGKTLRQEFVDYNRRYKTHSKTRLLRRGHPIETGPLELSVGDRLKIVHLFLKRESSLEDVEIRQYFSSSFFETNFWHEFCTVFAFQPWHSLIEFKRYFLRFIQNFPHIDSLEGMESTPYNQYEFLILPIIELLKKEGVTFLTKTKVTDVGFVSTRSGKLASRIHFTQGGITSEIVVAKDDFVFVTLGSLVANSSTGEMFKVPALNDVQKDESWTLWEKVAKGRPEFGVPSVFNSHINKSTWTSFTITFRDSIFFDLIDAHIHKKVSTYGAISIIDSNWFATLVLFHKPYFLNQPEGVTLCWGYGLKSEEKGNFVQKKMSECTGEEILIELVHHLGLQRHLDAILKASVCIPSRTPYVTSLFLPRKKSDRPMVVPRSARNFAFLGQYVEIPDEVVFTVEHSVRSAQIAVYELLKVKKVVPPIYKGIRHIGILYRAAKTLFR